MLHIDCPLCGKKEDYSVLYDQKFEPGNQFENIHLEDLRNPPQYRIVKCLKCGLVYSNPVLAPEVVEDLYRAASSVVSQYYALETDNVNRAYSRFLRRALKLNPSKERILDIGCGSGFFLQLCLKEGFNEVYGVEPSVAAFEQVPQNLTDRIRNDVFRHSDFTENSFDIISFFHVLDHIVDLNAFLKGVWKCLKKGGIVLAVTHNIDSWLSAITGESWDPINMAHTTFFNKETLRTIFTKNGFSVHSVFSVANTYSIGHWVLRSPFPRPVKRLANSILRNLHIHRIRLTLKVGNIGIVAQKPFA